MRKRPIAAGDALTSREIEVVRAIATGHTNESTAHLLGISIRTVEVHRYNARLKLSAWTAAQLIVAAHRAGIVRLS